MIDDDLVEPDGLDERAAGLHQRDLEHGPLLDAVVAGYETAEAVLQVIALQLGEKSQAAEVHPEDRDAMRRGEAGPAEEGAVTSEREHEVGSREPGVGVAVHLGRLDAQVLESFDRMRHVALVGAWRVDNVDLHGLAGARWTKISRFPSAPATSDAAAALTS